MYPEISVNMGNLLLSLSDALDLAYSSMAMHQLRTAFIAWELCRQAKIAKDRTEQIFLASILHDIGALSIEEKYQIHQNETDITEPHCIKGKLLFQDIKWLNQAADIVRFHHKPWSEWNESINSYPVLESQIVYLADYLERSVDRSVYILHQDKALTEKISAISGKEIHADVVDMFMDIRKREEFWLDLVSPRLYSLLLHNGPFRKIEIDIKNISTIIQLFRNIIDFKSEFTATHSSGVAQSAKSLSKIFGLTETECELMEIAGHLHDLGKLVVPNSILEKPDKLTKEEFAVIKQHTYYTFSILITINGLQQIAEWGAYHHEKLDGRGYPFHKEAKELSVSSRIMAVADVFTALAEDRPYRKGMSQDRTIKILSDMASVGVLDNRIVTALIENADDIRKDVKEKQEAEREYFNQKFNITSQ